jgi:hypothetical protein
MFIAPITPSAVDAWMAVKPCSSACGMKWVRIIPIEV